jgi:hypothetical protein
MSIEFNCSFLSLAKISELAFAEESRIYVHFARLALPIGKGQEQHTSSKHGKSF